MKLKIKVKTNLLIGGYNSSTVADKVTARDERGLPIIPASAIKGVIREEFERIARAKGIDVCDSSSPETMHNSNPCIACKVFGGVTGEEGKLRFSDAVIKDERLEELFKNRTGYAIRDGVTISRRFKTALEKRYFNFEATSNFIENFYLEAEVVELKPLDDEERKLFKLAVRNIYGIGGSKSRGYGIVTIELEDDTSGQRETFSGSEIELRDGVCLIKLKVLEPLRASSEKPTSYFYDTYSYIPGSVVRGAFAKQLKDKIDLNLFNRIFLGENALIFSNLYPWYEEVDKVFPKPFPLSMMSCKAYPGFKRNIGSEKEETSHGAKDILIPSFIIDKIREKSNGLIYPNWICLEEDCGESLMPYFNGYYTVPEDIDEYSIKSPPKKFVTKTALSRSLRTAVERALYSYEIIEPFEIEDGKEKDLYFYGYISNLTGETLEELKKINTLYLGGARSRGFGKVKVQLFPLSPLEPEKLLCDFNESLWSIGEQLICNVKDILDNNSIYFSITLISDLIPGEWSDSIEEVMLKVIGFNNLKLEKCFIDTCMVGGWNDALKISKDLTPAISMGSSFVFSIPKGNEDKLLKWVKENQYRGLGVRREEGFGHFLFCAPIHYGNSLIKRR